MMSEVTRLLRREMSSWGPTIRPDLPTGSITPTVAVNASAGPIPMYGVLLANGTNSFRALTPGDDLFQFAGFIHRNQDSWNRETHFEIWLSVLGKWPTRTGNVGGDRELQALWIHADRGRGMSLDDTAARLGVKPDTLRKRAVRMADELPAEREARRASGDSRRSSQSLADAAIGLHGWTRCPRVQRLTLDIDDRPVPELDEVQPLLEQRWIDPRLLKACPESIRSRSRIRWHQE